jgi:hypothetical protein
MIGSWTDQPLKSGPWKILAAVQRLDGYRSLFKRVTADN